MAKHWATIEAEKLAKRITKLPEKGYVLFATGFSPTSNPHIGTFGEVVRTSAVRNEFIRLTGMPTKLFVISDDYDGMRSNRSRESRISIPEQWDDVQICNIPVTCLNTDISVSELHNNKMIELMDSMGIDYEFKRASKLYRSGEFDYMLEKVAELYDEIMDIMIPTLGEERQKTYSPFLPISEWTNKVLYIPIEKVDKEQGMIGFTDDNNHWNFRPVKSPFFKTKLQWKVDFSARWIHYDIDFEMFGKDHGDNLHIYQKLCRAMGGIPPQTFTYELFLDEDGSKISKSKDNGISLYEWLQYASQESLAYFMLQKPKTAKKLSFDVISKSMDEYHKNIRLYHYQNDDDKLNNPVYHIHNGDVPEISHNISYSLLLNMVCASMTDDVLTIYNLLKRTHGDVDDSVLPIIQYVINYFNQVIKPTLNFRVATDKEMYALIELADTLQWFDENTSAEELQTHVFEVGKNNFDDIKDWFLCIYQVLFGSDSGARMGSFIHSYGVKQTIVLIEERISDE